MTTNNNNVKMDGQFYDPYVYPVLNMLILQIQKGSRVVIKDLASGRLENSS